MKTGRPTKFDETIKDKVQDYLDSCVDIAPYRDDEGQMTDRKVSIPTVEGFARYIGVNKTSLYEWKSLAEQEINDDMTDEEVLAIQKYQMFSNSLDQIVEEQKRKLIENGLAGNYNSTIAKLILSSNHGMAENTKADVTSNGQTMAATIVINKPE